MSIDQEIKQSVRTHYGAIAEKVLSSNSAACCGSSSSCCGNNAQAEVTIAQKLYKLDELEGVPLGAALASLGCGNPTVLAELKPGEVVLDLGSGGGIDVILSARRVGPSGRAYGLDMTDSMLELARRNAAEAGVSNVEFLRGDIESIPLPDGSVDVIISNCVINLSTNKDQVLREAFRVLKPGGRFAVSDVVIQGGLPDDLPFSNELRQDMLAWAGCVAGALSDGEYRAKLEGAGFTEVEIQVTHVFRAEEIDLPDSAAQVPAAVLDEVVQRFTSSFVRARKPF